MIAARIDILTVIVLDAIFCFVVALLGAIAKDVVIDTVYKNKPRIDVIQVLTGSFLSTLITLAAKQYIDVYMMPLLAFILGAVGYELFMQACTIDGLIGVTQKVRVILSNIFIVRDGLQGKPTAQSNLQMPNVIQNNAPPLGQKQLTDDTIPKKERE